MLGLLQTCIKRIRLDMPMTPEDFAGNPDDGGGHEDNATAGGSTDAVILNFIPKSVNPIGCVNFAIF